MKIKEIRLSTGMTQKEFGEYLNIPRRTIENWEGGKRTPPEYVVELIEYKIKKEEGKMLKELLKKLSESHLLNQVGEILAEQPELFPETLYEMGRFFEGMEKEEIEEKLATSSLTGADGKLAIEQWIDVEEQSIMRRIINAENGVDTIKLTELREGGKVGLTFEGTLGECLQWLDNNYHNLFGWIDDDIELPNLESIETVNELKAEMKKVDHSWWSIDVKLQMKQTLRLD